MSEVSQDWLRLILNKGLDVTIDGAWDWYRERRLSGADCDVLREHVIAVSQACDGIVRSHLPDQKAYYAQMILDRIGILDDYIEKSAQR